MGRAIHSTRSATFFRLVGVVLLLMVGACEGRDSPTSSDGGDDAFCSIPESEIAEILSRDGIPSLEEPVLVGADEPGSEYLLPGERVIGLVLNGSAVAVPHRVGWWHEIVNLNIEGRQVAVTYCPLTGSSLVFDRSAVGGGEFGVSGLLFRNNLIMFDRTDRESLWPQMARRATCGPRKGEPLEMVPAVEMTWEGWTSLHPDTRVPGHLPDEDQNFANYRYPYGNYEEDDNESLLVPMSIDSRRPPKERVLGIPGVSVAFPFSELDSGDEVNVADVFVGRPIVVFWDGARRAAAAYRPRVGDQERTFEVRDGRIVDRGTESAWNVMGRAVEGPLAGEELTPVTEAHVAFWFAWAAFNPGSGIWTDRGGLSEF